MPLKQLRAIFARERKSVFVFIRDKSQVKQGRIGFNRKEFSGELLRGECDCRKILEEEANVIDGVLSRSSIGTDCFNYFFKRTILMSLRIEDRSFRLLQKFVPGRILVNLQPERQKIHEATDKIFQFRACPAGRHCSDDYVCFACPFLQDDGQGSEQRHKWSAVIGAICFSHGFG